MEVSLPSVPEWGVSAYLCPYMSLRLSADCLSDPQANVGSSPPHGAGSVARGAEESACAPVRTPGAAGTRLADASASSPA